MASFNIYLVDFTYGSVGYVPDIQIGSPVVLDSAKKQTIKSRLETQFTEICHETNYVPTVQWVSEPSTVANHDLVCYFLNAIEDSIVKWKGWFNVSGRHDGFTMYVPGLGRSISEIYLETNISRPSLIGDLCMHELMHNKLEGPGTRGMDIHRSDPGGIGQAELNEGRYSFTRWDISHMRAAIGRGHRQVMITKQEYLTFLQTPFR